MSWFPIFIIHILILDCFRKCRFSGESLLTFAVRIGSLEMVKVLLKEEPYANLESAVFKTDETSISAFEISYQHKEINKFLKAKVSKHSQSRCSEMEAWYTRLENSKSIYCSKSRTTDANEKRYRDVSHAVFTFQRWKPLR